MPRDSEIKRHIRTIVHDMRSQGAPLTSSTVKQQLTSRFPQHLRKKQRMLDTIVAQELAELQDLMNAVDLLDVPTPEPGVTHVSMSLMNQRVSANYSATAASDAAAAVATVASTPNDGGDDAGSSAAKSPKAGVAKKRKRSKGSKSSSSSSSSEPRGMWMGKKSDDIEGSISAAVSSGS